MNRNLLIIVSIIIALIAITLAVILINLTQAGTITSEELEEKANSTPEVKAFLNRYGETEPILSSRSMIYQKTQTEITGIPYNGTRAVEPIVVLTIAFDYDSNIENMLFQCVNDSGAIELAENILEYLETEYCFS